MKRVPSHPIIEVPGFTFAGISAGIKKSGMKDLALIFSDSPAEVAALFTNSSIKAPSVKHGIEKLAARKKCRAVIINSGNANACTGAPGVRDDRELTEKAADVLGLPSELVYSASTGIIGKPLPMAKIKKALPVLAGALSSSSLATAASAIMTTDTFEKISSRQIKLGRKTGTIAGIAKGAGMICPNMATMLCFIVTDVAINRKTLDAALRDAVKKSFNRITVDNDMSTNDTVMALANGSLGNRSLSGRSPSFYKFKKALEEITYDLARMIVQDGEGATKLVEVAVKGAATEADAEKTALSIAKSMLVKTAVYGQDPNWGRIMAAIGYADTVVIEEKIDIWLNNVKLVSRGIATGRDKSARKALAARDILISVDLGMGKETAKALTCDLTKEYININAHYST